MSGSERWRGRRGEGEVIRASGRGDEGGDADVGPDRWLGLFAKRDKSGTAIRTNVAGWLTRQRDRFSCGSCSRAGNVRSVALRGHGRAPRGALWA